MIIRSTMATWCFYCVFLLCVVNHCCKEHSGEVDICSDATTTGNTVRLNLEKNELERVCKCTALVDKHCMNMSFTDKLQQGCDYFHESPYPGIDPNCTIQSVQDNQTCTQKLDLWFRGERLEGHIMTISVSEKNDVNLNVTCRMLHKSALSWTADCNVSHNILETKKTAFICSQRTNASKPALSEDLVCSSGITVTNVYVGVKEGRTLSDCNAKNRTTGNKNYCCERETTADILFNAHCLEQLQKTNEQKQYQTFLLSVDDCDKKTNCKVNDTILPIDTTLNPIRKFSSYFIVEYECTGQEITTTTAVDQSTHSNETKGGMKVEPEVTTTTAVDQSTHSNETKGGMKVEPEDKLLTYVIAGVVAGVFLVIVIVTVLICIRKRRSSDDKHVYMTVERTAGQELQTFAGGNTNDGRQREDGFEDIPLESDNELDPLYDQADQQDLHSGAHTCKSDGTSSEDVYDHTNNKSGIRASAIATTASGGRDEDDTYDHAGDSCKKTKERPTPLSDEDLYDHTGGPSGGPTRDLAGGPSGGPKNLVQGGVYGKLNHDDDVYDHAIRQSLKSPSNTDCASNTYGRLNLNPEDGDVHNHTGAGEKKVDVIDEQYTTLNP